MINYPAIDPVALQVGSISIYWYGIMYLASFIIAYAVCHYRKSLAIKPWHSEEIVDLLFFTALGVVWGGAWGFFLLYQPNIIWEQPLLLFKFWQPGRSFHGGLIGGLIAIFIFSRKHHRHFFAVTDFVAPIIPIGLGLGRLGNFINGELWGRITDVPWAMVFPAAGVYPRHPSQLYEFASEGIFLFAVLWCCAQRLRREGALTGLFLILYGLIRFCVEYFREPDSSHGFIAWNWLTMGQILSIPMLVAGFFIMGTLKRRQISEG